MRGFWWNLVICLAYVLCVASVFCQGGVGNCVSTLIGMMAGAARGFNSVIAAFATAKQTLDFTSELLIHENVYKWIHCRVARDQNNRSNVGDVTIFMGRAEIV